MFTGIVIGMATVEALSGDDELSTLTISSGSLPDDISLPEDIGIGDSVCISGCCLTVTKIDGDNLSFEVMGETLRKTTLGERKPGDLVNIEPSMRPDTQMGGHVVSGHVDGIGEVVEISDTDDWHTISFRVPDEIKRLVSPKGSITIDGTSLTIIDVDDRPEGTVISIGVIPHTLTITTHGRLKVGDKVNMEADMLARYVLRLFDTMEEHPADS